MPAVDMPNSLALKMSIKELSALIDKVGFVLVEDVLPAVVSVKDNSRTYVYGHEHSLSAPRQLGASAVILVINILHISISIPLLLAYTF